MDQGPGDLFSDILFDPHTSVLCGLGGWGVGGEEEGEGD